MTSSQRGPNLTLMGNPDVDYYSPLSLHLSSRLFPTLFGCCIVSISNPILLRIECFLLILSKAIFTTIELTLVRTIVISVIVPRAQTRDDQRPWLAKYTTHRPLIHAERKIQK